MIVPNAGSTVGDKYDVLDQSEPDEIDFEILGNLGRNFVFSGGAVTSNGSATNVAVAAAAVIIDGSVYSLAAVATQAIPSAPVNKRFDLVIARKSGTTVSVVVIFGADSTNPVFPKSRSVLFGVTFDPTQHYDPATDIVLAALYRPAGAVVTDNRIVDKRCLGKLVISNQGAATPTAATATSGQLYYKNNAAPTGTGSNVFVGGPDTNWIELAQNPTSGTGPYVPIGGVIIWPTTAAAPVGFLDASGGTQLISTYTTLAGLYGTQHGGNGTTTFGIPNLNGGFVPKGTTNSPAPGSTTGADSITLAVGQLPAHAHDLNSHTHTLSHTHGIDHDHPAATTGFVSNDHTHSGQTNDNNLHHNHNPDVNHPSSYWLYEDLSGGSLAFATVAGAETIYRSQSSAIESNNHQHAFTTGGVSANHNHSFDVPNFSGSTVSQSASTTSGPSTSTTLNAGSGSSVSTVQSSMYVRYIIRAL